MSSSMIACKGGHKSGCVWQTGTMAYPFNGPLERQHTQFIVALVIDDVNVQVMEVEDDCIVQRRIATRIGDAVKGHSGKAPRNTVEVLLAQHGDLFSVDLLDR